MKHPLEIVAVLILVVGAATFILRSHVSAPVPAAPEPIARATYSCDGGTSISAAFYKGAEDTVSTPGEPPHPHGSVSLSLSDGRTMTLAQTISADGGRYANFDESFVFWSKGNGALVLENDKEKSFVGCVVSAPATAGLPQAYSSGKMGFSIRLPKGYTAGQVEDEPSSLADPSTSFTAVQFTIPTSFVEGTNLGADTFIRVAEAKQTDTCSANSFLPDSVPAHVVTDGGVTYSVATVSDAAAGNRYDNTVYALPDSSPCLGIFYYIHYSVFENYPPGTVKKFDEPALIKQFDAIRRTLVTK